MKTAFFTIGAPELILISIAAGLSILPALWGYFAGSKRSVGALGGLLLGFFLNFLGVIIVYCTRRVDQQPFYSFPNQTSSTADELQKFKSLLDSGAITEQEYNTQKTRILNQS